MRADLLALAPDDLVILANRGLVKRAQGELQAGELRVVIEEDHAGTVTAHWSDDVTCVLPGDKPASASRCTCPATTLCRHIVRSILAYQQARVSDTEAAPTPPQPWNPGAISDDELARHVSRSGRAWARQAFDAGQVIELVRSAKPSAYMHSLACSVRFLVPNDLRYTSCDCADPAPCRHVPLAVWAFRTLHHDQASGIVETTTTAQSVPTALLDDLEGALRELVIAGVGGAPQALAERLRRIESRLRTEQFIWPADALADLVHQHATYAAHDARFAPTTVSALLGELCARADAIRANTGAVPQLFVRGSAADRDTPMGTARLIGLGCGARVRRGGAELAAFLQDADSGALMVVRRDVDDGDEAAAPIPFWQLAQMPIAKGAGVAALGGGQALIKGGRRMPNGALMAGRAQLSLNPQAYAWESLRAPVLAEDFAELAARLTAHPPAALRPRRLSDGFFVCAVARAAQAAFDPVEHGVRAVLSDSAGEQALLVHPYTTRGQEGVAALLAALATRPDDLRFVAGHVRLTSHGLVIAPTALVFQDGATRFAVLPWVAREQAGVAAANVAPATPAPRNTLADYWAQIDDALGELLIIGVQRADEHHARRWRELARFGAALGFGHALQAVEQLALVLEAKARTIRWDAGPAASAVLELSCVALFAADALSAP